MGQVFHCWINEFQKSGKGKPWNELQVWFRTDSITMKLWPAVCDDREKEREREREREREIGMQIDRQTDRQLTI